jgi:hypothetical protein
MKGTKTADRIRKLPGVQYIEWETDQWVCYTVENSWFPDLECQTCIDTRINEILYYAKRIERVPEWFLDTDPTTNVQPMNETLIEEVQRNMDSFPEGHGGKEIVSVVANWLENQGFDAACYMLRRETDK